MHAVRLQGRETCMGLLSPEGKPVDAKAFSDPEPIPRREPDFGRRELLALAAWGSDYMITART